MTSQEITQFEREAVNVEYRAIAASLQKAAQQGIFSKRYPELSEALQVKLTSAGYRLESIIWNGVRYTKVNIR